MTPHSWLSSCTSGGCGAKIGPGDLSGILGGLPRPHGQQLLVGFDSSDDAAVYALNDRDCVISTVDFFPPMVEDAASFGRIAAANAMSDVWAMGGRVVLALNLVCFPEGAALSTLGQMLTGGAEKIAEAGAVLGGGHSIYDREPKYGLAVTGLVEKSRIIHNNTPRAGDKLILTKALGAGLVMAAGRAGAAAAEHTAAAVAGMERLNLYAAQAMAACDVSACTDVTGFGLLAHLDEMLGRRRGARVYPDALPVLPGAAEYAGEYLLTAAGQRNRTHMRRRAGVDALPFAVQEMLFDPQTSGGLLIACEAGQAEALLARLRQSEAAAIIGEIGPEGAGDITFQ